MRNMVIKISVISMSIASAMLALLLSGCEKSDNQSRWWQGEQERVELGHDLALKEYRLQQSGYENMAELEKLRISNDGAKGELRDLRQVQAGLILEVELTLRKLEAFRGEVIGNQRKTAMGKKFNRLDVADGRNFRDVTVASIDDAGVTIRHADGSARLRYAGLDDGQRVIFGLEESSSLAARQVEARESLAYERLIDSRMAVIQDKQSRDSATAKREEHYAQWKRSLIAASTSSSDYVRPLAQPAKAVSSRYSNYGNFSYYSGHATRPTYYYVYNSNRYNFASSASYYGQSQITRQPSVVYSAVDQPKTPHSTATLPTP